jgi:hypothetical protein
LFSYSLSDDLAPELLTVHADDIQDALPIRTFSAAAHAGFHDSRIGLLPYVFSKSVMDRISIDEVSPLVTSLPQDVPADYSSVPLWSPRGVVLKQVEPRMKFHVRLPNDSEVVYELQGAGDLEVGDDTITLVKRQRDPLLWLNLRIRPVQFRN